MSPVSWRGFPVVEAHRRLLTQRNIAATRRKAPSRRQARARCFQMPSARQSGCRSGPTQARPCPRRGLCTLPDRPHGSVSDYPHLSKSTAAACPSSCQAHEQGLPGERLPVNMRLPSLNVVTHVSCSSALNFTQTTNSALPQRPASYLPCREGKGRAWKMASVVTCSPGGDSSSHTTAPVTSCFSAL